jgi:protease-4
MLHGKELLVDESIGIGYLFAFAKAIENNSEAKSNLPFTLIHNNGNGKRTNHKADDLQPGAEDTQDVIIPTNVESSILKLQLNGYMAVADQPQCMMSPFLGVQSFANTLLSFKNEDSVKGAIIEINSGGGEATAGQILYNAIKDFGKPVVAYAHNAGSAGYMGLLSCKEIIASGEMARFGGIGAYISIDKSFISFYKAYFEDIYSDLSPEKNEEFRAYLENDDKTLFKESLNETVTAFHNLVKQNRNLAFPDSTLKGKMFKASDAKRRGLIDMIGSETLAIKRLQSYIK